MIVADTVLISARARSSYLFPSFFGFVRVPVRELCSEGRECNAKLFFAVGCIIDYPTSDDPDSSYLTVLAKRRTI